ncbi:hypothetical protein ACFO0N_16080 [Halobium salinum]|uniref:MFS transporter n=1 Tax=Halobium salinum TaxID=1364940 RepID=A0ABD5PEW9_9EURY|nr:hypothetical protein [Halobium salinum]
MNRDALVSQAGSRLFVGLLLLVVGNVLAGALGSYVAVSVGDSTGAVLGLLAYLLAVAPVLYVAAERLASAFWVVAEGAVHAANGAN